MIHLKSLAIFYLGVVLLGKSKCAANESARG